MRAAGVTLLAAFSLVGVVPAQEPTRQDLLVAIEKQLRATSETAGPCVACIVVSKSDRYPKVPGADQPGKLGGYDIKEFLKLNTAPGDGRIAVSLDLADPRNIPDHGYACGVVIDASGLILTPYHVVEDATKVYVHLPGRTGSYADVHAADSRHDLAVLKLITPPPGLTPIKFANVRLDRRDGQRETVGTGTLVVLLANAYAPGFKIDQPSAALGSIANVRTRFGLEPSGGRLKLNSYYYFGPLLAYDTKLNVNDARGAAEVSGAALLNLDGELIGLTTTFSPVTADDRAPHYAFPADDTFRRVVDVLRRGEEVDYGYLGVSLDTRQNGIFIQFVTPQGPAARAGVEGGDSVTQVNGVPVGTYDELLTHVGAALADAKVKITVRRFNRDRELTVTLGKLKHDQPFIASVRPDPVFGLRVDYSSILAQKLPLSEVRSGNGVPAGVCVRELAPNSQAAAAFKKLGDRPERWLITHINGAAVSTPAEFYKTAKGLTSIKLTVKDPTEHPARDHEVSLP